MCSHALSTHRADNEVDFSSSVEGHKGNSEDAGASMIGTLRFNSATYYRYVAINLDMFAGARHLGGLSYDARKDILRAFPMAVLRSAPGARENSINASTLPQEVIGFSR